MLERREMASRDPSTKKPRAPAERCAGATRPIRKRAGGAAEAAPPADSGDMVLVHGKTEDGQGLEVLRKRGDEVYAGQMRPIAEGKAITGEVVSLRPRAESPLLFDVDVLHRAEAGGRTGPAKVATDEYRAGWKSIFGEKGARKRAGSPKDLN